MKMSTTSLTTWSPTKITVAAVLSVMPLLVNLMFSLIFRSGSWYQCLNKPRFMPCWWIYMLVWMILYPLLGVSTAVALVDNPLASTRDWILPISNILVSLFFIPVFFGSQSMIGGMVVTLLCLVLGLGVLWQFASIQRDYAAAGLMVPYVVWMAVALFFAWSLYGCNGPNSACETGTKPKRRQTRRSRS